VDEGLLFTIRLFAVTIRLDMQTPRILQVRQQILKKNDQQARDLRSRFRVAGVFVVSMVSSPGSGKTTLLRQTLIEMSKGFRVAALVGDLATENDAKRLGESGVPVKQIITGTVCHLEAEMVERALDGWDLNSLDVLFIENVGNLVCPSSYDLGEDVRIVLFSTTEGEDKPLKYPTIFNTADVAIITKMDLADVLGFDRAQALASIESVRPGMHVIELSARKGDGMDRWIEFLLNRIAARRHNASSEPAHAG
jgi:hydrogenase nickel incorporation protein HypB